jgi:hypothetical protein
VTILNEFNISPASKIPYPIDFRESIMKQSKKDGLFI